MVKTPHTSAVVVGNQGETMIDINLNPKHINVILFVGVIDLQKGI